MPLRTTVIPASARTASNRVGYLLSRSRMRCFTWHPVSCRSMTRLRAVWVTQAAVGCAVAPGDTDAAAGVLDDGEDVHPGAGQRDGLDEVRRHQRVGLRA